MILSATGSSCSGKMGFRMTTLFCSLELLLSFVGCSLGVDTLISSQSMKDGETLVSADGSFVLGFFSKGNSSSKYLGMWYSFTPDTVVWVANRKNPVNDSNGVLTFRDDGNLVILDRSSNEVWSSKSRNLSDPEACILDTGNLVLGESSSMNSGDYSWQSFDYPSDTLLPGMKLGWDLRTGFERHLTSWKSSDDPVPGEYTFRVKLDGLMEGRLMMGSTVKFRTGPWNGVPFTCPSCAPSIITELRIVDNETDAYYEFELLMKAITQKLTLNPSGLIQFLIRKKESTSWNVLYTILNDFCDIYGQCGANGFCTLDKILRCRCLPGFVPKSTEEWLLLNHTSGCVREIPLNCSNEGFRKVSPVNLPDLINFWLDKNMSLEECKNMCWNNCSCTAYANSDIRNGGSGCLMWFGNLHDVKEFHGDKYDQDMYIRLSALSLDHKSTRKRRPVIASVTSAISGMLFICLIAWTIKKKSRSKREGLTTWEDNIDLPLFNFATVADATDNFSQRNLIGAGGFGSVYKGNLLPDKEVAIKRLSKDSGQGLEEFMNEVVLIAKLQHKNLVGLLGCCIEREERMLIYEYMPNKSLDFFLFDHDRSGSLPWEKRYGIVSGIARGLLYLHQDSKLQVIHRDLKASNILLDGDLNPKISDFGLARIFRGNDKAMITRRIMGTYGYMSPEYAFDGKFSMKSDVFSFGVLLLEIICGEKNRGFRHPEHDHNLLGHAWLLWNEGKSFELVHASLRDSYIQPQVERCIHVALLCVQKFPDDRPVMSSVVFMLVNEGTTLPRPKKPGFFLERNPGSSDVTTTSERRNREGFLTMTMPEAR